MDAYFESKREEWIDFVGKALRCKSLSGCEKGISDLFYCEMKRLGIECYQDTVGNPVGVIRGNKPGPTVMLAGHIDVVPAGNLEAWGDINPFDATVDGDKLYGRGISDMIGGLACAFFAFCEIKKLVDKGHDLEGNLVFAGNVYEETAECLGALYLLEHTLPEKNLKPDVIYLAEPSKGNICLGHRGKVEIVVDVHGKVAHSSTPYDGVSALQKALPFINSVYNDFGVTEKPNHKTGVPTVCITDVELTPGKMYSCVPDLCRIRMDRRYVPPMTLNGVIEEIENVLAEIKKNDPEFVAEVYPATNHRVCFTGYETDLPKSHPFWSVEEDNFYVQITIDALNKVGQQPKIDYWQFGTDGSAYCGIFGIPVIGYSCADDTWAHQPKENVSISKMLECIEGYTKILYEIFHI